MKKSLFVGLVVVLAATLAFAQDPNILKPPKGSKVAILVWEDLQCPDCRRAAPLLEEAGRTYKIPVVRHDFPLPKHNWSMNAALNARYFDTISKQLGNAYRDYCFEHQLEISPDNLRGLSEKFAADHKVALPFVVDPQGKFAAQIAADRDLGTRIGLEHTPTIYVVSESKTGKPFVEVVDRSQLFSLIDSMLRQ
jgi:protein-disulfide isomerase